MSERRSDFYHAHVYFEPSTRESAAALQTRLLRELPPSVRVSRLVERPIGPHPKPMFELGFAAADLARVREALESGRGRHSVLIHQVTEDEVWDHTEGADWLGERLALDLQFLRDFMAGHARGVSQTVPFDRR